MPAPIWPTGPAFFARLIHVTDQRHYLAFTMHHIVCDGWSNGILIRDFTDFYGAFISKKEPALPELPFQFADFTVWQQNWLESDAAQAALAFWRRHIRRELPAVDLPTDSPRLHQKSYPGHIESTLLPAELTTQLKEYCRAHNATMHQVLLAAFQALIARYTSQNEFLLGSTIANRTQPGMENVVGRFANPQVIFADVNGDPTYTELLHRVSEWSTDAYAHQDLPFSRLMEEFQLDQAGATSQFLQVYFVYQKAFMQPQEAAGLKVTPRPSVSGGVNFDLLVSIVERAEGPRLQMEYNTVLFRKERILSLIAMYVRVLEAVMRNDAIKVSQLPLVEKTDEIAPHEGRLSTLSASAPSAEAATEAHGTQSTGFSLTEILDRHALSLGEAPAILAADTSESVSWKSLQLHSLSIARALRQRDILPGQLVVLQTEPSWQAAATAWALLRVGAVILPLPASTGHAEWIAILASHKPAMAIASVDFARDVTETTSFDQLLRAKVTESGANIESGFAYFDSSSVAWLAFDIGTDKQQSIIHSTHEATLRQLQGAASALDMRANDVVLVHSASSTTDAWIDLLLPLIAGSTILYVHGGSADKVQKSLERYQVSFVITDPQGLLAAVNSGWSGDRRLNVVCRGGLLDQPKLSRLEKVPLRLWSVISSPRTSGPFAIAKIADTAQPRFDSIAGQRLIVVDEHNQSAPNGVTGELALQTESVILRTGFLARTASTEGPAIVPDAIEVLDTVNRLVRLHGYRLRLGEFEEYIWQNSLVADVASAVISIQDVSTLVGYFKTYEGSEEKARLVREKLKAAAPGHFAAAELIHVDRIPRLSDGSPDVATLPAPGSTIVASTESDEYLAPRDELEAQLVAVWEDVLGVRPIGVRTSFFKLGGYSLMIVRLFARINKALNATLPITTIFNAPTVEKLADIVRGRTYYSTLVPVQTKGSKSPFFMIHSYLLYQGVPSELGDDIPFYGLRELDTDAKDMTVEQRAATCLEAMRSVQPKGPYYIGGWCAAGPLAVETARQIQAGGDSVGYLVLFDSWRPGYAAELSREQARMPEMSLRARLYRKYLFHRNRWQTLNNGQRVRYVWLVISNKFSSSRDKFYLKNWAIAEWFCKRFGFSLPHFMHNVSLTTLNSLKEYRGVEAYPGPLTLIRAKEAPYIPGAQEHCGWNAIVKGEIKVLWAPGDHETMFIPPHIHSVGEFLRQGLAEAHAKHPK